MNLRSLLSASPRRIRHRMLRDLVALILLTVGLLVAGTALLIDDLKRDLAQARIGTATTVVRDEVQALLTPVRSQLLILHEALRGQRMTPADVSALNALTIPVLTHIEPIAGAVFAAGSGAEYYIRRDGDAWLTRVRAADASPEAAPPTGAASAVVTLTRWSDANHALNDWAEDTAHDARQRPWFALAAAAVGQGGDGRLVWSPPYRFTSLGVPGVTAAIGWRTDDPDGDGEAGSILVAALDLTLARIMAAIGRLELGDEGQGFLFSADGGVFSERDAGAPGAFYSAERQHGGTIAFEAVAAWRAAGEPAAQLVRFKRGGRGWWGGFLPLDPQGRSAWVGVAIPMSETLGLVATRWDVLLATALGILALGVSLAVLLARKYSQRLREQPRLHLDPDDPERDLYDLIGRGEGTNLEFKSTLRMNLHTGKAGKEIELAWLKGATAFLNTEGGILLFGIADDGTVLGLAADGFANDDKVRLHFKNLINQHLGAELARFLRFDLYALEGCQVGVLECEPADAPAFLRHANAEQFLIRLGPSNIELPVSRALGYIRSRF